MDGGKTMKVYLQASGFRQKRQIDNFAYHFSLSSYLGSGKTSGTVSRAFTQVEKQKQVHFGSAHGGFSTRHARSG
jgi:hypothetical protein